MMPKIKPIPAANGTCAGFKWMMPKTNALAVIATVVNPEAIVIGGGVSKAGEILLDYIKPYYEKNVFQGSRDVKFALATLGNDAGIYGAAKLILGK